jgi:cytochrome c6
MRSTLNPLAFFLLAAPIVVPVSAQTDGADVYKAKCALCHGAAGLGDTPTGKALKAASFTDPAIVKAPDDELIAAVKTGKGKMPPNNGRLTDAQIAAAIAYIRTLQK